MSDEQHDTNAQEVIEAASRRLHEAVVETVDRALDESGGVVTPDMFRNVYSHAIQALVAAGSAGAAADLAPLGIGSTQLRAADFSRRADAFIEMLNAQETST